jgi:hypothetical protein
LKHNTIREITFDCSISNKSVAPVDPNLLPPPFQPSPHHKLNQQQQQMNHGHFSVGARHSYVQDLPSQPMQSFGARRFADHQNAPQQAIHVRNERTPSLELPVSFSYYQSTTDSSRTVMNSSSVSQNLNYNQFTHQRELPPRSGSIYPRNEEYFTPYSENQRSIAPKPPNYRSDDPRGVTYQGNYRQSDSNRHSSGFMQDLRLVPGQTINTGKVSNVFNFPVAHPHFNPQVRESDFGSPMSFQTTFEEWTNQHLVDIPKSQSLSSESTVIPLHNYNSEPSSMPTSASSSFIMSHKKDSNYQAENPPPPPGFNALNSEEGFQFQGNDSEMF